MTAQNGEGVYGDGAGVVTPLAHKLSQNGPLVKDSTGKPRSGVFYAGNASLVSGKANMSYDVAPFEAAICRARTKGTSYPTNDAVVNVATTAAPGSNSRIDIIYFQQKEVSEGDDATEAVVGVVQGTAASSPSAPSLPDGAIELARAVVGAGITATTSATITQTAPFTAPLGSPIPFRNSTERDAAGTFAPYTRATLLDTGAQFVYSSGWKTVGPFAQAAGVATTTTTSGSGSSAPFFWSGVESVTFPVGRFSVAPLVVASPASNSSASILPGVQVHDITTSGFTYRVFRIGAAPAVGTAIHWEAVQMLAASAAS